MTNPIRGIAALGEPAAVNPSAGAKTGGANASNSAPADLAGADSVNVSQTQSLLQTINQTAAAVPTVNPDIVSAMRQAIASGTYKVNPQQVAKQLLSSDHALSAQTVGEQ